MNVNTASPATSSAFSDREGTVGFEGDVTVIRSLSITDPSVARYLGLFSPDRRAEELARAISIGVHGLTATSMRATVDDMTAEVGRILESAAAAADAHLGDAVEAGRSELAAHLDPEIRSSLTARTVNELGALHEATLARLDPDRSDSHTSRLVASISELLGPQGLLSQRLEEAFDSAEADHGMGRLVDTIEKRFQEIRDLVVGEQQRSAEAERGTAKGVAFEDEIESMLRNEARSHSGCIVERTGQLSGSLGAQSKVGDFALVLPEGTRVAIEVKNTNRVGLTGATGILHELDQAMDNREASWALCISRTEAYPGEVGSFGIYGNRLLVVDSGDGTLTRVALRWIAAAARAAATGEDRVDTGAALERLSRLRDLAQHFSRSKKVLGNAQSGLDTVREELDSLRGQLLDLVEDVVRAIHNPDARAQRVA
ncbi:MAG: hypothetical protein GY788_29935 [bacterium]|nr:hypothetical protein [bacterium]